MLHMLQATILFPGVACFFLAFCAGAATHVLNEMHVTKQKYAIDRYWSITTGLTLQQNNCP